MEERERETLLVPEELTDLVLVVVMLEVDDPLKDEVLLDEIEDVIVVEDDDVFE